jgi:hypothetical protein
MRHAHRLSARSFDQEVRHPNFFVGEAVLDDQAVDVRSTEGFSIALN